MQGAEPSDGRPVSLAGIASLGPVLAVIAHPDDESFGLGAILAALAGAGADVRVLCLTHGEASTLGATGNLGDIRRGELARAARQLGITKVTLEDFPDGGLGDVASDIVDDVVERNARDAALLVVFEPGGVTGHPDHRAATASAHRVARRRDLIVLEWGVAPAVASALNAEVGTAFVALDGCCAFDVEVNRAAQRAAIACHESQSRDNPVLARRLALEGDRERVRLRNLTRPRSGLAVDDAAHPGDDPLGR